ncbi:hypothetical protein GCM10023191_007810 [Actinoallomurus oryzae]|uniref:Uncharacterized protein n=1 Tax=Actinoallomurus oryzae TaxID=502180 RepID=A0ABP8PCV1_9ACTN
MGEFFTGPARLNHGRGGRAAGPLIPGHKSALGRRTVNTRHRPFRKSELLKEARSSDEDDGGMAGTMAPDVPNCPLIARRAEAKQAER